MAKNDRVDEEEDQASSKSVPSSFHKPDDHNKVCRTCGYYGCEGICQQNEKQNDKKEDDVQDKGQAFESNQKGLIDRQRTEKLFLMRM